MMRKAGVLMLVLLYTVTASGFNLHLHYCGNRVADVQINAPAKSCVKPMAKSKMKCCKDSKLDVKVKDSHELQQYNAPKAPSPVQLPHVSFNDFFLPVQQAIIEILFDRGPPNVPRTTGAIFIKNCILRI
ncbi:MULTISPECIES: HYC_CC_PP family protein [unclassified Mucilaginibacter]|uniref:HYC_CC_PP family protein n=1 Tax=unclassified Mucilaginibacter TaxID=2617802 RepID=UPI000A81DD52|nr:MULTISPECIES: hypothetical protein [unclassified Mucilaginibacter]HEK20941.1 hypothetical protein [Bacteroidota bacterium]